MNTIYQKIESILASLKPTTSNENIIDLQQTFNSQNIDTLPIIKKILSLPDNFPNNILHSTTGHKYHELEFFESNLDSNISSHQEQISFFQRFNRTQTCLGSHLLQSILLKPLHSPTDINNILINRQKVIKSLAKYDNKFSSMLLDLAKLEQDVLAMGLPDTPEMQEVYKIIFFDLKLARPLNYSETFQKIFCYFLIIFSPLYGIVSPFIFMFAPFLFLRYVMKVPITFDVFWNIIKNMILGGTGFFANLNKMFTSNVGTVVEGLINPNGGISIKSVVFWIVKMIIGFMNSQIGTYAYIGFIVISYLYGIYNSLQVSITYNKVINMFHSRMNIISKWLKQCVAFYNLGLCFESVEITAIRQEIDTLLQHPTIRVLLEHKTFSHEPGVISNKGIIIKTFREFLDAKELAQKFIEPFSHYLAYVDAFSAISSWLRENNSENKTFCTYLLDHSTPSVKGTNVWNICCTQPVYNDIILGSSLSTTILEEETVILEEDKTDIPTDKDSTIEKDNTLNTETDDTNTKDVILEEDKKQPLPEKKYKTIQKTIHNTIHNNTIITGANGAGKSTYIKSVIECIILGQTIGVVPASEFIITPFTNITTYLNIPDCQGKESLFQAEMSRCHQQLQMLESAEKQHQFSFNIMDEIFVSTNYKEGMSGAYAIINQLCKFQNCLNIITTHFDVLANMEDLQVNKHYFDIEIDDEDNITRDYKIKPGVNTKHMALKLLKKKGFSPDIIKDAEYLYEQISK